MKTVLSGWNSLKNTIDPKKVNSFGLFSRHRFVSAISHEHFTAFWHSFLVQKGVKEPFSPLLLTASVKLKQDAEI